MTTGAIDGIRDRGPALAGAVDSRDDFPDWLAPMVVKELRQGLRARWFVVPFVSIQAAALLLVWLEYRAATYKSGILTNDQMGHQAFWALVFLALGVVLPLRSLTGLSGDLAADETRLILLAGLSRWGIVLGKWLTQLVLSALVLISLVPFLLVRYFFGGVEFLPNLLTLGCAMALSAAMNAILLGASGFPDYWVRGAVALAGALYVGAPMLAIASVVMNARFVDYAAQQGLAALAYVWTGVGVAAAVGYYCLCGLQLARSRLRAASRPWEVPPSRPILSLFFLSPFYFAVISFASCGLAFPVVAGGLLWWMWSLDPSDLPVRSEMHFVHPAPTTTPKNYRF